MATKTVRLDSDAERLLGELTRTTGLTTSAVLRKGLYALKDQVGEPGSESPYEIYKSLDLGPGGNAIGSSASSRKAARQAILAKHHR